MSDQTRIVILGGGYAGVEAAKKLHKRYKRRTNINITLIDRNPYHTLMTELHEIAGSRTEPEAVQISYKRIFAGTKVKVIIDEIDGIDFAQHGETAYDLHTSLSSSGKGGLLTAPSKSATSNEGASA